MSEAEEESIERVAVLIADLLDREEVDLHTVAGAVLRPYGSLLCGYVAPEDYAAAVGDAVLYLSSTLLANATSAEDLN